MHDQSFTIKPESIAINETEVYAQIDLDKLNDFWSVTLVFSRPPDLAPIQGKDVDVQLLDAQGSALNLLERPSGPLAEFGGGLGNSANAHFRFQSSRLMPAHLLVSYHNQTVNFQIVPLRTD